MSKIRSLAALNKAVGGHTGMNMIDNGDFSVWQRGESFDYLANGDNRHTADRWYAIDAAETGAGVFRVPLADNNGDGGELKIVNGTATSHLRQGVEWNNQFKAGSKWTVSFDAMSPDGAACNARVGITDAIALLKNLLEDFAFDYTIDLPTAWQRYSYTFTIPDAVPLTATMLAVNFSNPTANSTQHFRRVQLEPGDFATDFQTVGLAEQLERCRRFCVPLDQYTQMAYGNTAADTFAGVVQLQTPMRTLPVFETPPADFSVMAAGSVYPATISSFAAGHSNLKVNVDCAGVAANHAAVLRTNAGVSILSADFT